MESVKMRDCGDGYRRACVASFSPLAVKTAAYTIVPTDAGKVFSNRGATGSVTLTLPAPKEGFFVRIFKPTAQNVVVTPTNGAKINGGTADTAVTIAVSYGLWLVASDGTDWMLTQEASATLAGLEQGTDGQLIVGQTGLAPAYKSVTGDVTIDKNGLTAIGAGKVLSSMLEAPLLRYATVAIANSEIKLLRSAPKALVAAPGANKVLEFVSAVLKLNYATAGFTEVEDNMAVKYTNGSGAAVSQAIEATGFIDQVADTVSNALPKADAIVAYAGAANQALVLHNTGDAEYAAGGGTMTVKIAYRVHDFS